MSERKKSRPGSLGKLIDAVLESAQSEKPFRPESVATVAAWPSVVPEKIASFSRAVNLTDGRLHVEVTEPAWKQELLVNKSKLIRLLNQRMGAPLVGDIVFKVRDYIHDE